MGEVAAELTAALVQVVKLFGAGFEADVGREVRVEFAVVKRNLESVAERLQVLRVSFFIWCVALRLSKCGPSIEPLIVWARTTVGCPACCRAAP